VTSPTIDKEMTTIPTTTTQQTTTTPTGKISAAWYNSERSGMPDYGRLNNFTP